MQVTDKLTKALTEAKYLNADNVSRYRCIMRIFLKIMKNSVIGCTRRKYMPRWYRIRFLRSISWNSANRIWQCLWNGKSEYDTGYA